MGEKCIAPSPGYNEVVQQFEQAFKVDKKPTKITWFVSKLFVHTHTHDLFDFMRPSLKSTTQFEVCI